MDWKVDSWADLFLGWYPHYTGTEGTLYLQSATIWEDWAWRREHIPPRGLCRLWLYGSPLRQY